MLFIKYLFYKWFKKDTPTYCPHLCTLCEFARYHYNGKYMCLNKEEFYMEHKHDTKLR